MFNEPEFEDELSNETVSFSRAHSPIRPDSELQILQTTGHINTTDSSVAAPSPAPEYDSRDLVLKHHLISTPREGRNAEFEPDMTGWVATMRRHRARNSLQLFTRLTGFRPCHPRPVSRGWTTILSSSASPRTCPWLSFTWAWFSSSSRLAWPGVCSCCRLSTPETAVLVAIPGRNWSTYSSLTATLSSLVRHPFNGIS